MFILLWRNFRSFVVHLFLRTYFLYSVDLDLISVWACRNSFVIQRAHVTVFCSLKFTEITWLVCKVYAGDMSPENREFCGEATEPLLEAVDNLVTYASSPEFASVPAKISSQVFLLTVLFFSPYLVIVCYIPSYQYTHTDIYLNIYIYIYIICLFILKCQKI